MDKLAIIKQWAVAALVRAVKTMAETALALIGTNYFGITDVDWIAVLSACALAGLVAVLTCVAGIPEVADGSSPLGLEG